MSERTAEFIADARATFRKMWTWPETYAAVLFATMLGTFFMVGGVRDLLLKESIRQLQDVKVQNEKVNTEIANVRADLKVAFDQNQQSMKDRHQLNEDKVRLEDRVSTTEKNQANIQKALENAQKSFNEARDVLRRLEQNRGGQQP